MLHPNDTPPAPTCVSVVIPALNEEATIADVVRAVPRQIASEVIVVDNGSEDRTAERAREAGAHVVREPRRGYGSACYAGVRALAPDCGIVDFIDGDGSDGPELLGKLAEPIIAGTHDFVLSSRLRGRRESGSMYFPQVFAGRLIGLILYVLYGVRYTDMGPFRAIRRDALLSLGMREMTYGWPVEMQMRAARARMRILEVPVDYRRRKGGESKISGTIRGTILAGTRILMTLARIALERR
jgi:glycosyltransferase involved in cell wall biosynthesis